jgi:hypothetical protein
VAKRTCFTVLGAMTKAMVFDMAWTLQGEGDDELPEQVPPL